MTPTYRLFYGTFIHLPRCPVGGKHVLSVNHGAVWVSAADGRITGLDWDVQEGGAKELLKRGGWVEGDSESNESHTYYSKGDETVEIFQAKSEENEFFFPGFIDTHIHASQYPNSGVFGSSTLLDWLETYTFPLESSYSDTTKAEKVYDTVVSRTLSHGTTCASYFATIHVSATNALASICHSRGQRAFIGRICMDSPSFCPEYYRDSSAKESISATKETIKHIHTLDPEGRLVNPIITPRFAPSCSHVALEGLGELAAAYNPPLYIQTHISENKAEVQLVRNVFPESSSYASVYDGYKLLTRRTILAHGIHLSPAERELIKMRDAGISHCPASNSALGSGICPVRTLLDEGIKVGLGTDVSGGYSSSILEAVRQACLVSRLLGHTAGYKQQKQDGREKLSVEEGLYLATRGGAQVVDMAGDIGGFETGMLFDTQLIRLGSLDNGASVGNVDVFGWESWKEKVDKWVWTGDDRNVRCVWVNGQLVMEK